MKLNLEKILFSAFNQSDVYVKQEVQVGDYLLVVLDRNGVIKYGDNSLDRNIYAINNQGNIVWQIEPLGVEQSPKPYTNITLNNGDVIVGNWLGIDLLVDISNGKVSPYVFGKKPW